MSIQILTLPNLPEAADISNWIAAGGTFEQLNALAAEAPILSAPTTALSIIPPSPWKEGTVFLGRLNKGELIPYHILANAVTAIRYGVVWDGVFGWDEFQSKMVFRKECPILYAKVGDAVEDQHIRLIAIWLQRSNIRVRTNLAGEALSCVAEVPANRFHPVRDYFDSLKWDGVSRLSTWLRDYLGVTEGDPIVVGAEGQCFLISVVARVMKPGEKVDTCLILESPEQGTDKSKTVKLLAIKPEWFSDQMPRLDNKDAFEQLHGKLIIEIAEIDKLLKRHEAEIVKSFLSTDTDTYRRPYGHNAVSIPRQTVFIGTTNQETYFNDPSGNRRFWPVKVGKIDLVKLKADLDQLYAEAVFLYKSGVKWWLDPRTNKLAEVEQDARRAEDPATDKVMNWCLAPPAQPSGLELQSKPGQVIIGEILEHVFGVPIDKWPSQNGRVTRILKIKKWTRCQRRIGGKPTWVYCSPDAITHDAADADEAEAIKSEGNAPAAGADKPQEDLPF